MVSAEVAAAHNALPVNDEAFSLTAVIGPVSVINFLLLIVVHAALSIPLAIKVAAIVNIPSNCVAVEARHVSALISPAALIRGPICRQHLALPILDKVLVLAKIDVAIGVE